MTLLEQVNLEDFVANLETELSSRYTEQDEDFSRTQTSLLEGEYNDPPILAPWRVWEPRSNNNNARGNRGHRSERLHRNSDGHHSNQESYHSNQERYHSNAENHRGSRHGNHYGNRFDRNRPHHAKPYDRPYHGRDETSRYDRNARHDRGNRYEGNNRYEGKNRYERGGGSARYNRRPGLGSEAREEERRYGHYHDTKRDLVPDDSEWT